MGVKDLFWPTRGKMVVMIVFLLASFIPSSISSFPNLQFDIISQLQLILLIPWFLFGLMGIPVLGIAIWLIYLYVIDVIYVGAYNYIEKGVRQQFPNVNKRWEKRIKK